MTENPESGLNKAETEDNIRGKVRLLLEAGIAADPEKLAAYLQDQDPLLKKHARLITDMGIFADAAFVLPDHPIAFAAQDSLMAEAEENSSLQEHVARLRSGALVYNHFAGKDPRPLFREVFLEHIAMEAKRLGLKVLGNLAFFPDQEIERGKERGIEDLLARLKEHEAEAENKLKADLSRRGMNPRLA